MIDNNIAIAGELTWQGGHESVEGFYEGQGGCASTLKRGNHSLAAPSPFTARNWWKNPRARRGSGRTPSDVGIHISARELLESRARTARSSHQKQHFRAFLRKRPLPYSSLPALQLKLVVVIERTHGHPQFRISFDFHHSGLEESNRSRSE
jgi:hypothetical protein